MEPRKKVIATPSQLGDKLLRLVKQTPHVLNFIPAIAKNVCM